jgi:quercetin dioxygenase-like cupin family protein
MAIRKEALRMSNLHLTRWADAQSYAPPHHSGVTARRHHLRQADGGSPAFVSTSTFAVSGSAESTETTYDTIYVILDGELELSVDGQTEILASGDSVFLPAGTVRSLTNRADTEARLVVVAVPGHGQGH